MKVRFAVMAILGMLLVPASAAAQDENDDPSSSARAGLCFPEPLDGLGGVACTKAAASEEGAESEAHPLLVINSVVCEATPTVPPTSDAKSGEEIGDETEQGSLFLLVSSCEAFANTAVVAEGEGDAAILEASSEQGSVTVGESHSEAFRNPALGRSEAEFTLLEVEAEGEEGEEDDTTLTVLHCESVSQSNPSGNPNAHAPENETSGTLISDGTEEGSVEDPGLCALFVESSATSGDPNGG